MPEIIVLVPAILFVLYRVAVILVAAWIARPTSRIDLKRFERAMSVLGRQERRGP